MTRVGRKKCEHSPEETACFVIFIYVTASTILWLPSVLFIFNLFIDQWSLLYDNFQMTFKNILHHWIAIKNETIIL